MLSGYLAVALFVGAFTVVALAMLALSFLMGPSKPGRVKGEAYECGVELLQDSARERYSIPFYLVAMLFILFDVETVFLLPWAVGFRDLAASMPTGFVIVEATFFVGVLGLGLLYVILRRGLEWD